jgi:hypothetical protein
VVGRVTAIPKDVRVSELREMFRFLLTFRTLHETCGTDEIVNSFGNRWTLWDLEYLYEQTARLNLPQRRAITLCLVHGQLEREAARAMGVGENNPVGMYASLGLRRLLDMLDRGDLPRFGEQRRDAGVIAQERREYIASLAAFIRSKVQVVEGHWLFPTPPGRPEPAVLVRSPAASCGVMPLHPRAVLYENEHGPIAAEFTVVHPEAGPPSCINPRHSATALTDTARERLRAQLRRATRRTTA